MVLWTADNNQGWWISFFPPDAHTCWALPTKLQSDSMTVFTMNADIIKPTFPRILLFSSCRNSGGPKWEEITVVSSMQRTTVTYVSSVFSSLLTTRGGEYHLDKVCHNVMRNRHTLGLTQKVFRNDCRTHTTGRGNVNPVDHGKSAGLCPGRSRSVQHTFKWNLWGGDAPHRVACHGRGWALRVACPSPSGSVSRPWSSLYLLFVTDDQLNSYWLVQTVFSGVHLTPQWKLSWVTFMESYGFSWFTTKLILGRNPMTLGKNPNFSHKVILIVI